MSPLPLPVPAIPAYCLVIRPTFVAEYACAVVELFRQTPMQELGHHFGVTTQGRLDALIHDCPAKVFFNSQDIEAMSLRNSSSVKARMVAPRT